MKKIIILLLVSIGFRAFAQNRTISGTLRDRASGETIIGANIYSPELKTGASTNVYGFYSISLPPKRIQIVVSCIGYQTRTIDIDIAKDVRTYDFDLDAETQQLQEVIVKSEVSKTQTLELSTIKLTPKQIKAVPAFMGEPDIQQVIVAQAGVSSVGEGTSGFNVRGGKTDQNLVLVDEAPVYNSSHLNGFVTVVDPEAIKSMKFYKAGIPARYGGRASSVLDIQLKDGNLKKVTGAVAINPIVSKISLEVPIIENKLNAYFTIRRTFVDFFTGKDDATKSASDTSAVSGGTKLYFYDATAKINYFMNDNNKFFLSFYAGEDKLSSSGIGNDISYKNETAWGNRLWSLRWNHIFTPKIFSNFTVLNGNYNLGGTNQFKQKGKVVNDSKIKTYINGITGKYDFSYFPSNSVAISFGIGATNYAIRSDIGKQEYKPKDTAMEYWGYAGAEADINPSLSIRGGLRYAGMWTYGPGIVYTYDPKLPPNTATATDVTFISANKTIKNYANLEPRFALNYKIKENVSVKLAYDRMAQYVHQLSNTTANTPLDVWAVTGPYLMPTISGQVTIGGAYDNGNGWNIESDIFFKRIKNFLEFRDNMQLINFEGVETVTLPAEAKSRGIELTLNKTSGKLQGYVNYTFSKTEIQTLSPFSDIQINQGRTFPSNYDRPHVANVVLTYPIGKRGSLSSKFTYQSGRPITLASGRIGGLITYSERNAFRIANTHRLDLSYTISPNPDKQKRFKGEWVFSVINLYGRRNPYLYAPSISDYDTATQTTTYKLKGWAMFAYPLPSFAYNIHF